MTKEAMRPPNPIFDHPLLLLLQKCKSPSTFKQAHAHYITTGLALHTYPLSRLLLLSAALFLPSTAYAAAIFDHIPRPTTFLYNTLISSFAAASHTHLQAFSLYARLLTDKMLSPNNYTYPSLFKACAASCWASSYGLALHAHIQKFLGDAQDRFVKASLLNFYSKHGKVEVCRYLFSQMQNPDLVSWNSIISACASNRFGGTRVSLCMEALVLFNEMQVSSLARPNEITLAALIGACGELGALSQGAWAHAYMGKSQLVMNQFVGTALVDMYGKIGRLDLAVQVFDALPHKDRLCYNAMMLGLAIHGHGRGAVELFKQMQCEKVIADDATLVVILCACSHAGMVEEGFYYFNNMEETFGITPKSEHYGCLVDLLSRAGHLEEAEEVVRRMPIKANAVFYRSLLGACRIHNKLEMGERVIRHLVQLEPDHGGNYVLLSNLYANIYRWDDVKRVRKAMKNTGISKTPGSSWIELKGAIHEFSIADETHPCSKEIYAMLGDMGRKLHESGHKSSTRDVLFDAEGGG